jgi:hypothetical protein
MARGARQAVLIPLAVPQMFVILAHRNNRHVHSISMRVQTAAEARRHVLVLALRLRSTRYISAIRFLSTGVGKTAKRL